MRTCKGVSRQELWTPEGFVSEVKGTQQAWRTSTARISDCLRRYPEVAPAFHWADVASAWDGTQTAKEMSWVPSSSSMFAGFGSSLPVAYCPIVLGWDCHYYAQLRQVKWVPARESGSSRTVAVGWTGDGGRRNRGSIGGVSFEGVRLSLERSWWSSSYSQLSHHQRLPLVARLLGSAVPT